MRNAVWITLTIAGTALVLMPQILEGVLAANGAWIMGERQEIATMEEIGFAHNAEVAWASIGIGAVLILVGIIGVVTGSMLNRNQLAAG